MALGHELATWWWALRGTVPTLAEEPETPTLVTVGVVGALRGISPALAEEARGRISFRAVREGFLVFASKARSGPIPLPLPLPLSVARKRSWGRGSGFQPFSRVSVSWTWCWASDTVRL